MAISKEFIKKTVAFWEKRYGHKLTEQEALDIIQASVEVFRLLFKWNQENEERGCKNGK